MIRKGCFFLLIGRFALKQASHLALLDGMRGFAAFSVLAYHLGHWLGIGGLARNSYLAVDFFFCLSGFVLPAAYGRARKPDLTLRHFMKIRLIRLMPLIILATVISATYLALKMLHFEGGGHLGLLAPAVLFSILVVPVFHAPAAIGGPQIFPLNGPEYTLFLELAVNTLWFLIRGRRPMILSAVLAAFGLVGVGAMGIGGDTAATFLSGFPRVLVSFFIGVLTFEIYTRRLLPSLFSKCFGPVAILAIILFYWPVALGRAGVLIWIAALPPTLVLAGASMRIEGIAHKLCLWAGALSYPVYVLQYPIFCWINGILQTVLHQRIAMFEAPIIFVAVIVLSNLTLWRFDEPVRQMLSGTRSKTVGAGAA